MVDGGEKRPDESALLNLGLLKGDEEEGWAERLGDAEGQVEGPVEGGDECRQEGALLNLGLLKGDDEEGWAERLGDPKGQVEGRWMVETRDARRAHCSN